MDRYIAIDFGAESGRLIVGTMENQKLEMEEIYRFRTQGTMLQGNLRWNVVRLWEEVIAGLETYQKKYGSDAAGIGIDSWGVSLVALNEYDELIYTPFHYRADIVADPMLDEFKAELGEKFIFNNTGIQFMALNSSTHIYATQKKFPNLLKKAKTIFMIPDYFYFLLTGKKITEYSNASTTQLLDVFERKWSKNMLDKLGCDVEQFPRIHESGKTLGPLLQEVQEQTQLNAVPVHVVATHDTGSAIAAIPHIDNNIPWAYLSSGTWSLLGVEIAEPIVNEKVQQYNLTNEGGVDGTVRLLKNIMGLWLIQECKREWDKQGLELSYSDITTEAEKSPAFQSVFYPDDTRFFSPKSMISTIQEYCKETNQKVPQTPGEISRCIFESLACRYREVIEWLEELTETKIQQIHIVGGGSKNTLLSQMTADITGMTVFNGPIECTGIGNLMMQAKASGLVNSLQEIRTVVYNSFNIDKIGPNGENSESKEKWEKFYRAYSELPK
jgi:rhamnulokinase